MQELIKVTTSEGGKQVVSAHELYNFLTPKTEYAKWIKRMLDYGFEEHKDFSPFLTESTGGRPITDYALTLDCAKEISMVQRSAKGKQARQYFLDMEKLAKNPTANLSRLDIAKMLLESETEREQLSVKVTIQQKELQIAAPKVQYYNEVLQSESLIPTTVIAKELGMSAVKLNQLLHHKRIIYKAGDTWVLYDKYQASGYTKPKTITYTSSNGEPKTAIHTYWTESGRQFIHQVVHA